MYYNNNPQYNKPNPNQNPNQINNTYQNQQTPYNNYPTYNTNQQQQQQQQYGYNYTNVQAQGQGQGQQYVGYSGYSGQQQGGGNWNQGYGGIQQQQSTQQQGYSGWQKWQQPSTNNNNTWQSQPQQQPQQQPPQQQQKSQFETWKQKPQQTQPQQLPQQQQQQAYTSFTTSITTPITRTNPQSSNIYPQLPQQPELRFQSGWVEDQKKNVSPEGQTSYISQIGNTTVVKNQGNTGNLWDQIGLGRQNFMNIQNQNQNINYSGMNKYPTQPQGNSYGIQNAFFTLNPIFDQKKTSQEFPSPYIKYKIIPYLDQKKALDVCSTNQSRKNLKKNNLTIWQYHGGPNQLFYIKKQSDGYCYIINVARGFAIQVPNTTNQDSSMIANPIYGSDQQKWKLEPASHGCYGIINKATKKALDLYHQSSNDGTPVIQWKFSQAANQKWRIVPA